MAVFSIIELSKIVESKRIDAEYYKPEYLRLYSKLRVMPHRLIGSFAYVTDGIHESIIFDKNSSINLISAKSPKENYFELADIEKISEDQDKKNPRTRLRKNDIIISTVGTIGNCAVVDESILPANSDRHVGILRIKHSYYHGYLSSFILSKYGRFQTLRESTGNVQLNLFIYKLKEIIVPELSDNFQKKIDALCVKARNLLVKSKEVYSQAESFFLQELGLKDFKPKYEKTYIASLSSTLSAYRVDAEYFQPAYEDLIEKLRENNIELKPFRKYILSIQKGIEPGSENYQDEGKPFIRVSNLSINGLTDRDQKYIDEELYQYLKPIYEPKEGDFLLTKDATPGISYVVKEPVEGIISSGILKLVIDENNEIDKEYLALCINSIIGKMQVERDGGGSVITHWKPEQIKRLIIPILPYKIQQKIASIVQQSHEARKKANVLLEIAKKSVEIAIEKNEEEAIKYIAKSEV